MCSFHVRQCIHRQYQVSGLTVDFPEDKDTATRFGGLQHIPVGLIDESVAALRSHLDASVEEFGAFIVEKLRTILDDYFVPTWLNHSLGRDFFSDGDLESNRTNNYCEQFHGKQPLFYKKKHSKLETFMYDDRLLQNHIVENVRLVEAGERDAPEENDSGDRRIRYHRRKLIENVQQLLHPNERAAEIVKRLFHLGKAAGMTALLD